jgi:hypothetical protein
MNLIIYIIKITIIILTHMLIISFLMNLFFTIILTITGITRGIQFAIYAIKKSTIFLLHYCIYIPAIIYIIFKLTTYLIDFFNKFNPPG